MWRHSGGIQCFVLDAIFKAIISATSHPNNQGLLCTSPTRSTDTGCNTFSLGLGRATCVYAMKSVAAQPLNILLKQQAFALCSCGNRQHKSKMMLKNQVQQARTSAFAEEILQQYEANELITLAL
jgi:hypothetical protein